MSLASVRSVVQFRNNVTLMGSAEGRPVVLAHGFRCDQSMWSKVVPGLVEEHPVVLFDHVGAGASDLTAYDRSKYGSLHGYAGDVLEILKALDLRDVVFVGHSVSAMIGVLAATLDPSRFGALVLVGPSPRYLDDAGYVGGFDQASIDSLLDELDANYLGWSAAMAPVIAGNADRPEVAAELKQSFRRTDPTIARDFAGVTFLSDYRRDLTRVKTPTLVIQCTEDLMAPTAVGEYVHRSIPGSELVMLNATGHCPSLSDPAELTATIRAYLDGQSTRRFMTGPAGHG